MCNTIFGLQHGFGRFAPSDRVMLFSRFSFDASVWQVFGALGFGATLVIRSRDVGATIKEHSVTHMHLVPSVLANLDPADYPSLRYVQAGGEPCPLPLAQLWASQVATFVNSYDIQLCPGCSSLSVFR